MAASLTSSVAMRSHIAPSGLACRLSPSEAVAPLRRSSAGHVATSLDCHRRFGASANLEGSSLFGDAVDAAAANISVTVMAVPKKKTSKPKKRIRRAVWLAQGRVAAMKALSLGKSIETGRSTSFVFEDPKKAEAKEGEEGKEETSE